MIWRRSAAGVATSPAGPLSLAAGAKDFIVKPFSAERVLKVIRSILSSQS